MWVWVWMGVGVGVGGWVGVCGVGGWVGAWVKCTVGPAHCCFLLHERV